VSSPPAYQNGVAAKGDRLDVNPKQDKLPLSPQARINQAFAVPLATTAAGPPAPVPLPVPRPPTAPAPVPQSPAAAAPAASGFFAVEGAGLYGEADAWQRNSDEMGAIAGVIAGARLTVSPLGPFADFVARLNNETSRLGDRCAEARNVMADIGQRVRMVKQRYGALDENMGATYDGMTKAA
jgi:hypothetical protein